MVSNVLNTFMSHNRSDAILLSICRLLCFMPVSAAAVAACAAPRVEVYTQLACWELRPEYTVGERNSPLGSIHTKIIERRKEWTEDDSIDLSTIVDTKSFSFDANFSMNAGRDDEDNAQKKCAKDPVVQAAVAKLIAREFLSANDLP